MELDGNQCHACAIEEENQIMELRLEAASRQSILGNIYVGQVENIAANIQAAFVLIAPGVRGYFPIQEAEHVIYASGKAPGSPLRPGDQILVQVSRDAMKGKLPALTANLNFTGKYLVHHNRGKEIRPFRQAFRHGTSHPFFLAGRGSSAS